MKIRELLKRLKTPTMDERKYSSIPDTFFEELKLEVYYYDLEPKLVNNGFYEVPIAEWLCTDTYVGYKAIYYNETPLAITYQSARKNDTNYYWLVPKKVVIETVLSYVDVEDDADTVIDIDGDISQIDYLNNDVGIHVSYSGQVVNDQVYYQGRLVDVINKYSYGSNVDKWTTIDIKVDGKTVNVPMKEILVPYNF